jgi:dolichyl-phosphate beta-glucosyltransferase
MLDACGQWLLITDADPSSPITEIEKLTAAVDRDAARRIFSKQQSNSFGFDVEDLFLASLFHFKVVEVHVRWNNVEGTKVSLIHGLDSFLDPLRVRWFQLTGKYR